MTTATATDNRLEGEAMMADIEQIPSISYSRVIQVNVPTRFYWYDEGFDGIEFGPFTNWRDDDPNGIITAELTRACLDAIGKEANHDNNNGQ